jgi:hypothetical protein
MSIKKGNNESDGSETSSRQRLKGIVMLALFLLLLSTGVFVGIEGLAEEQSLDHVEVRTVVIKRNDAADGICLDLCNARRKSRNEHFGGDMMDRNELVGILDKAKEGLISKLKVEYGADHFENIFVDKKNGGYVGFDPITKDGDSLKRLKRKLIIKVLSVQTSIMKTDSNVSGCDCFHGDKALVEKIESVTAKDTHIDATYQRYVWATGGHSASAGHGNLFNESSTAFMERDLKPIFEAIGIEFEARNNAMGGTR